MKRIWIFTIVFLMAEGIALTQVAEMNWELDYEVFLKMENDSNQKYDIRTLFHITDTRDMDFSTEFVFYPVYPGEDFAQTIKQDTSGTLYTTLWSSLNAKLGGGWVHFTNCIAYALEMQSLDLKEPIMKRPETGWKPDPVTESWKRTRKWNYYIPLEHKLAKKEYNLRLKNSNPGDLRNLPQEYIDLFLSTSDKQYEQMKATGNYKDMAKIDLVKVILGANYLGEEQINYMSNAVLSTITSYSSSKLPSVLVFDEFNAAAAMSLDASGYKLESLVFKKSAALTDEEMKSGKQEIIKIIETINQYNRNSFKKRLGNYYTH